MFCQKYDTGTDMVISEDIEEAAFAGSKKELLARDIRQLSTNGF